MSPSESGSKLETASAGSGSGDGPVPSSELEGNEPSSSQGMGSGVWKNAFFEKLCQVKTFGDFACSTRYTHHPNPGLEVAGSLVPLPLVERDASMIKSKCEQGPFGRGDNMGMNESVKKVWQLDDSYFRCSNPAWPAFLDTVLRETTQKLGMYVQIHSSPRLLL
jgi:hypothetical protein